LSLAFKVRMWKTVLVYQQYHWGKEGGDLPTQITSFALSGFS